MTITWGGNNWEVYEVSGSLVDVCDQISGMPEAGKAEWNDSSYELSYDENGLVTDVQVTINPKVKMPTWIDSAQAPQAAQDEWNRWFTALEDHENGHLQILYDNAAGVDERMKGKTKDGAEKIWHDTFENIQKLSDEYDHSTKNGQNTGTIMNQYAGAPAEGEESGSESESEEEPTQ